MREEHEAAQMHKITDHSEDEFVEKTASSIKNRMMTLDADKTQYHRNFKPSAQKHLKKPIRRNKRNYLPDQNFLLG